jgi:hypothetical protein
MWKRAHVDAVDENCALSQVVAVLAAKAGRRAVVPQLAVCVAVPVRDEVDRLPATIRALVAQRAPLGHPEGSPWFEVVLLVNNCRDGSATAARQAIGQAQNVWLVEANLPASHAHVGWARRLAMDLAEQRLASSRSKRPVIATTDADTIVAPDWLAATLEEVEDGADVVGGALQLDRQELRALSPALRRRVRLDRLYRQLEVDLRRALANQGQPRYEHYHHSGASLAITRTTYLAAGRLPPVASGEDVALVRHARAQGATVRLSHRVRVRTSCRTEGRAAGGMAATLGRWAVEGASVSLVRGVAGILRGKGGSAALLREALASQSEHMPIEVAIAELRRCLAVLRSSARCPSFEQIKAPSRATALGQQL